MAWAFTLKSRRRSAALSSCQNFGFTAQFGPA